MFLPTQSLVVQVRGRTQSEVRKLFLSLSNDLHVSGAKLNTARCWERGVKAVGGLRQELQPAAVSR